jgi:hypothetical protein
MLAAPKSFLHIGMPALTEVKIFSISNFLK